MTVAARLRMAKIMVFIFIVVFGIRLEATVSVIKRSNEQAKRLVAEAVYITRAATKTARLA